jgi:hypothetical protein
MSWFIVLGLFWAGVLIGYFTAVMMIAAKRFSQED